MASMRDRVADEQARTGRLANKYFPSIVPHLIVLRWEYWQARRAGWDPLSHRYARDATGLACDPSSSEMWLWWLGIGRRERVKIAKMNREKYRVKE